MAHSFCTDGRHVAFLLWTAHLSFGAPKSVHVSLWTERKSAQTNNSNFYTYCCTSNFPVSVCSTKNLSLQLPGTPRLVIYISLLCLSSYPATPNGATFLIIFTGCLITTIACKRIVSNAEPSMLYDVTHSVVEAHHVTKCSIDDREHTVLVICVKAFTLLSIKVNESLSDSSLVFRLMAVSGQRHQPDPIHLASHMHKGENFHNAPEP